MRALAAKVLIVLVSVSAVTACSVDEPKKAPDLVPSAATYGELMVGCLSEYGFHGTAQGTGLIIQVEPEQHDAYTKADAACQARYGFDTMGKMTDEELGELYQFELQVKKCLEDLGYEIELPTEQVYIDTYYSAPEGEGFLLPHTQMMQQSTSGADVAEADSTCKQAPILYDRPVG